MRLSIYRPDSEFCQIAAVPELAYRMMLEDKATQEKHGVALIPWVDGCHILEGDKFVGEILDPDEPLVDIETSDDWESMYEQED